MIDTIKTTGWSEFIGTGDSFENQIDALKSKAYYWEKRFNDYKKEINTNNTIKRIIQNPKKNATTVIFEDGEVVVIKRSAADPEADIYSIVAYAVAKKIYKTNSAFKRMVDETIVIPKKKKGDE